VGTNKAAGNDFLLNGFQVNTTCQTYFLIPDEARERKSTRVI